MQKKARPRWNYSRMKLDDFPVFAQNVVKKMTGNIHFQNPVPDLQTLQNSINKLKASMIESRNKDTVKVAIRKADRKVVEDLLRSLAGWLIGKSRDREILMTSGMEIAKGKGARIVLGPPRELDSSFEKGKSGYIKLRWKQPAEMRARMFVIEQATGNISDPSTVWQIIGFSKKCRFSISSLTVGQTYTWRVYGMGSLGAGGKSYPVSSMVV